MRVAKNEVLIESHRSVVKMDETNTSEAEIVLQLKGFTVERNKPGDLVDLSSRCNAA